MRFFVLALMIALVALAEGNRLIENKRRNLREEGEDCDATCRYNQCRADCGDGECKEVEVEDERNTCIEECVNDECGSPPGVTSDHGAKRRRLDACYEYCENLVEVEDNCLEEYTPNVCDGRIARCNEECNSRE